MIEPFKMHTSPAARPTVAADARALPFSAQRSYLSLWNIYSWSQARGLYVLDMGYSTSTLPKG